MCTCSQQAVKSSQHRLPSLVVSPVVDRGRSNTITLPEATFSFNEVCFSRGAYFLFYLLLPSVPSYPPSMHLPMFLSPRMGSQMCQNNASPLTSAPRCCRDGLAATVAPYERGAWCTFLWQLQFRTQKCCSGKVLTDSCIDTCWSGKVLTDYHV